MKYSIETTLNTALYLFSTCRVRLCKGKNAFKMFRYKKEVNPLLTIKDSTGHKFRDANCIKLIWSLETYAWGKDLMTKISYCQAGMHTCHHALYVRTAIPTVVQYMQANTHALCSFATRAVKLLLRTAHWKMEQQITYTCKIFHVPLETFLSAYFGPQRYY